MYAKNPCLLDHTVRPSAVGGDFTHRIVHFEDRRAGVVHDAQRRFHVVVVDAVMLLNQGDLAGVNGGFANQSVGNVFFNFLRQQSRLAQVLEHWRGQPKAVGHKSGDQSGNHHAQRRVINRHATRSADAEQGQQVVAANPQRQNVLAHAGLL